MGPSNDPDGAKWNAMLRPADVIAARIEGLREASAIKVKATSSMLSYPGIGKETIEIRMIDGKKEANLISARIADLEAAAPEVSEMHAKAEAFDALLAKVQARNDDGAYFPMEPSDMLNALAEAKRKGEGR